MKDDTEIDPIENKEGLGATSFCDVLKENTSEVILKLESTLPSYIENFSVIHSEYLRIARDLFSTCYIAEKEMLDTFGIDQRIIEEFNTYLQMITKATVSQIGILNNLQKMFFSNAITAMKSYDEYVRLGLGMYSQMIAETTLKRR